MNEPPPIDVSRARTTFKAIKTLDLSGAPMPLIDDLVNKLITGYAVIAPIFEPGLRLFRARICDRPFHGRELLYPPPLVTRLGRCNREGQPVLYCATSRQAAYFEIRPQLGDKVVVSEWQTTKPLRVNHIGYVPATFARLGTSRQYAGWSDAPAVVPDSMTEIANTLADLFTEIVPPSEEYRYTLTAALATKFMQGDLFDGIIYPTIVMRANADNFALKPSFVDTGMRFVKAELATIDRVHEFSYDITVVDTAGRLLDGDAIDWKGRGDQWVIRENGGALVMVAQNGKWVAYDLRGNIVEPE
jgi:hypothetical protein